MNIPDVTMPLLEVCLDSVESALAAEAGGATRVELCGNLSEGGTTPSAGMIAIVRERVQIAVHVMMRPRAGDFHYSRHEIEVMEKDIAVARQLGAEGIVIGALTRDGRLDAELLRPLIAAARPMSITLHRSFDACADRAAALADAQALGFDRILTAGGARNAEEGIPVLRELVAGAGSIRSAGGITILPGGGITHENAARILRETGARELHTLSAVTDLLPGAAGSLKIGARRLVSAERVASLLAAIESIS